MASLGKWIIGIILEWLWPKLVAWGSGLINKAVRYFRQKKAQEKFDEDVEKEKPRTEETKKNEEDWLNS